ncbi:MAG TPA: hypothetical protein ENI17_04500 [Pseudomonas xinjiangensis]|uniref:Protoporphyrinogen IX oxidase n=2 Tax=root TaxID=1 RepID=A0A7V1BN82_9GAMM|nr:hypothetical protein [Halopseudomonas xinjiangensis]HEC46869.1 hypothetical protein [Halopseudomonas xinjiangensis]
MLWFLVLHIMALLFWAASLLYLPALIAGSVARDTHITEPAAQFDSISRFVFTHVATPAALVAIIAGTLVFLVDHTVDGWLVAKLTLVTALVLSHTLAGMLILRAEAANGKPVLRWCWVLGAVVSLLIGGIIWVVLAKPPIEDFL